jgi:DNA-binding SARP family transcriptional activator
MRRRTLRLLAHDDYDDYDEQTHLELVRGLVRAGRRGEARRRYRAYCQRMTQLHVTPAPFPDS